MRGTLPTFVLAAEAMKTVARSHGASDSDLLLQDCQRVLAAYEGTASRNPISRRWGKNKLQEYKDHGCTREA